MRLTLATLLSNAVSGVKGFRVDGKFDREKYMEWIGQYQVSVRAVSVSFSVPVSVFVYFKFQMQSYRKKSGLNYPFNLFSNCL